MRIRANAEESDEEEEESGEEREGLGWSRRARGSDGGVSDSS